MSEPGRRRASKRPHTPYPGPLHVEDLPTERKFVTLLRADLVRSTDMAASLELEESVFRLKPALDAMRAAVRAHGGAVCRETGDGVIAVFGAPLANDRHATLGCYAALDLVGRIAALRDAAVKVRVGVHSGFVVAGAQPGDFATTYDVGGPPLFLIDRLQNAAEPGEILVSDETERLAGSSISFEARGKRDLKGFPQPVPVHSVRGMRPTEKSGHAAGSGFVGRSAEYARLMAAATAATEGSGSLATVTGEAGVGKSRLAGEASKTLAQASWTCVKAECNTILGSSPFALARDVVGTLLRLPAFQTADIVAALPPAQRTAIEVLLVRPHDAAIWRGLGRKGRGQALLDAVHALLGEAARAAPTMVLIEDMQWCDEASASVIEAMAAFARSAPLLVVVTARPGGLPPWTASQAGHAIELRSLDADGAHALVDSLLGSAPALSALKQRILDHTGGLPLFVIEVCRRLAEQGTVAGRPGHYRLVDGRATLDVPPTVHGVIAARVDRLPAEEKRLLQTVAAFGPRAAIQHLAVVAELPVRVLRRRLRALVTAALLALAETDNAEAVAFPHDLIRQVAYDAMLTPTRRDLHTRILATLEEDSTGGAADLSEALVYHAEMAREWSKAADHAEHIARIWLAQGALAEASRYFQRAIAAVDAWEAGPRREERAIDLRIAAVVSVGNSGLLARWLALASEAETRAAALNDQLRLTTAMINRAGALNLIGPADEAVVVGERALRLAEQLDDDSWLSHAEYVLGVGISYAGDYARGIGLLTSALHRLTRTEVRPTGSAPAMHRPMMCAFILVNCCFAIGDIDTLVVHQSFIAEVADRTRLPLDRFLALFSLGTLALARGAFADAEQHLDHSLRLARQNDLLLFTPVASFHLGLSRLGQGLDADAFLAFAAAEADTQILGMGPFHLRSSLYSALTATAVRDTRTNPRGIRTIYELAAQQGYRGIMSEALVVHGAWLLRLPVVDNSLAEEYLHRGLHLARELGVLPLVNWASRLLRTMDDSTAGQTA